jgi:hypothetical protein
MNLPRVAVAALVAWIAFCAFGYLSHAVLMKDLYLAHSLIMRSQSESNAYLPLAFGVSLVAFFAFAYAYAKGYEGGRGMQEGLRFGVLVGLMLVGFAVVWDYMTYPLSRPFFLAQVVDYIVEYAIYGMIVGTIYRPRPQAATRI